MVIWTIAITGSKPMNPLELTRTPKTTDIIRKNIVQFKVNLSLYTIAFLADAMASVVTPVHDKKKTDDIVRTNAFKNWYLYAFLTSLT